jgi:hypothetical protein
MTALALIDLNMGKELDSQALASISGQGAWHKTGSSISTGSQRLQPALQELPGHRVPRRLPVAQVHGRLEAYPHTDRVQLLEPLRQGLIRSDRDDTTDGGHRVSVFFCARQRGFPLTSPDLIV